MNNHSNQEDEDVRDPATRAFDELRDELARVRQSMEDLCAGIQQSRPHDYRRTLGEILRAQESVKVELQAIKSHPAINLTPDRFAHQIEEAKNEMIKEDRRKLKVIMDALEHNCITIKDYFETANEANRQKIMIIGAGVICFFFGTVFSVFTVSAIASVVPKSWQAPERIASNFLGLSMYEAGARLIKTNNPFIWETSQADTKTMNDNRDLINKCKKEMVETNKATKCMIILKK
jgi:hypothetical protein